MSGIKFEEIVREVSYRCDDGMPNWDNPEHISILSEVMIEMGYSHIKDSIISVLTEAPNDKENEEDS